MAKKFYAVKVGKKIGIYETWEECQEQVNGFSGAIYKSFSSESEAKDFINNENSKFNSEESEATAYVDGSYDSLTNSFSYGMVIFYKDKIHNFKEKYSNNDLAEMNNVAGEIKGAEAAMQFCLDNNITSLTLYYDYEGIAKWCNGEWEAKKKGTIEYVKFYNQVSSKVKIKFIKVKSHSGNKYNDIADNLAKEALETKKINDVKENFKNSKKSIFIERDKIIELIKEIGTKHWSEFTVGELKNINGNIYRCELVAENQKAMLNIFFNNDGTTTIIPTGKNLEISSQIKILLESKCKYLNTNLGKTYSIKKLSEEWRKKLINFLSSLEEVKTDEKKIDNPPKHKSYIFTSKIGDKLTINIYENGTLILQGKPAYLYGEAISFLSYCNAISLDDIIDSINTFHEVDIKINEVRNDMKILMPEAYKNIPETILKLLSPSISLRKINIDLEDYSCYAFPVLRALEGYIKYLFDNKGIVIGKNFGGIFNKNKLNSNIAIQINNSNYQQELERLYLYLKNNRHVIFHTEQILIGTTLIENKHEADEIINTVINLIETSYTNIFL